MVAGIFAAFAGSAHAQKVYELKFATLAPAGTTWMNLMQEWADSEYDPRAALEMVDHWHLVGRMATIEEIGEVCAFLASSEASFMTGQVICPDGGAGLGYSAKFSPPQ